MTVLHIWAVTKTNSKFPSLYLNNSHKENKNLHKNLLLVCVFKLKKKSEYEGISNAWVLVFVTFLKGSIEV